LAHTVEHEVWWWVVVVGSGVAKLWKQEPELLI
jgi:hypothetical protein